MGQGSLPFLPIISKSSGELKGDTHVREEYIKGETQIMCSNVLFDPKDLIADEKFTIGDSL
jgi:hypothetical protein